MKRPITLATLCLCVFTSIQIPAAFSYTTDSTVPLAGGCPQPNRWNLSLASPLNRRWSTSLLLTGVTILTVASKNTGATHRNRAVHSGFVRCLGGRHRHHLQQLRPPWIHRSYRAPQHRKFLLERSGK
jgi:hypothetical protein